MKWQKWARFLVAAIGIAAAVVVYATMGERAKPVPATAPARIDPKALIESSGNVVQQVRGTKQDYLIEAERQLTYEGGLTKLVGVKITVRNRGGRDYVVTGREAQAGERQKDLQLTSGVQLTSDDGFIVRADTASFNQDTGLMIAPGAVTFQRERMMGSGTGMSYDKNADVLSLADQSRVSLRDEHGNTTMEFTSGKSTLDRMAHTLTLDGNVHALRGEQVIDARQGVAHLTESEQHITNMELRGDSRVVGGGSGVDSMSARDMNLNYAAEGERALEHAQLIGGAAIAMTGHNGSKGRQFLGDTLDIRLAPDGSVTKVVGRDNVRLDLPGSPDSPARSIKARAIDADGAPGGGLTAAKFTDNVEYREESGKSTPARTARSKTLTVALMNDAISNAVFGGAVKFEEQGLQAASGEARYDPTKGSLRLTGVEAGAPPRVADDQVTIDALTIDVTLDPRVMKASGGVKTMLQANKAAGKDATKLPGLMKQDQPANVNADALDYQGAAGQAIYTGNATMWQGETAVRADSIAIDQSKGDFLASGNARSTIVLDTGNSIAHGAEIRYADAAHTITYNSMKNAAGIVAAQAQLSGPQGDLRADRIEVLLAPQGGHIDRLEAYTSVSLKLDTRNASGERLTYFADDERYVMSGAGIKSVKVIEKCRETTGRTLTFFKSTDRIIVDGNEEQRTQTRSGVSPACTTAAPARSTAAPGRSTTPAPPARPR
ncbi:MAG: LPS export ABC transporter periplasmic protein LptC [Acidobacteria bacterium]|nr:MAG: LPS export ABC transporter periplasmic protein LptC [Acidobacteriota bacterium]